MPRKISRNKRTVLFQHLPGQTYDFGRESIIARTSEVRGGQNTELNLRLLLTAIENVVSGWSPNAQRQSNLRQTFPQPLPNFTNSFVLIEPRSVSSELFPLVFWCQNRECGRVFSYTNSGNIPQSRICSVCNSGRLIQLRFIRIHRCGSIAPLEPFYCGNCQTSNNIALDTRGSEKIANFQWICRRCNRTYSVFAGRCGSCSWEDTVPNVNNPHQMNIQVHRAGKNFYPHYVTLLNQPSNDLNNLLEQEDWEFIVAASYLELINRGQNLLDIARNRHRHQSSQLEQLNSDQISQLRGRGYSDEKINEFTRMQNELTSNQENNDIDDYSNEVITASGLSGEIWQRAGYELLETVLPFQSGNVVTTIEQNETTLSLVNQLGLSDISLLSDFPISTAIFGYSREDYRPGNCYINPFPPDTDYSNRFPIYVDLVQADAIMATLDRDRVLRWLELNGYSSQLPNSTGNEIAKQKAFFVEIFHDLQLRETIDNENPKARLVFGLLHTLSHLFVRQAALLSGLEGTSLNEYVLPRSLSFAIYSSHRFGATIGALTALYEQTIEELLSQVQDTTRCVYDPVCIQDGGNCHACIYLSEISCQFFNLNLGRVFVFGGIDPVLDKEIIGYFEMAN